MTQPLLLLTPAEQQLRLSRIELDGPALIADNANLLYLTGRVFAGYVLLRPQQPPLYFVRRPAALAGENVVYIRKPEEIAATVEAPARLGLELGTLPYATAMRLKAALGAGELTDVSAAMLRARSVKTPHELELLEADGVKQAHVYSRIPHLYREGMTDVELQVEIERASRLEGCLGQFRTHGPEMELFMANILVGDNADAPSPYDFAMGGAGLDPSLPVGACGEAITRRTSVMVDANGNYNGYMTDMTRTFALAPDELPELARKAHQCSIDICAAIAAAGKPGTEAKALYELARGMAEEAGLADYFMGHRHHAGFVGHGVGIEINELPVLAPRSRDVLAEGNVVALEPKFVIPGTGAVGIENTYVVTPGGMRCITLMHEQIIEL